MLMNSEENMEFLLYYLFNKYSYQFEIFFIVRKCIFQKDKVSRVESYIKSNGNISACKSLFKAQFKIKNAPETSTIKQLHDKFRTKVTLRNLTYTGAPVIRTTDNIQKVKSSNEESPQKSVRRISSETGLCVRTVHTIVTRDLQLHP